jgi:hypothetical protein
LILLSSCVFEAPFEANAKIPVDPALLGRWEKISDDGDAERIRVLQHSDNEYVVEYPVGEKAMVFRAFAVELAGADFIQVQWIGTAAGPVKDGDRKYHLLKVAVDGETMDMRVINADVLGKEHNDAAAMKDTFEKRKDDPKLFDEPVKFRKVH